MDRMRLAALVERVLNGDTQVYEAIYLATKDNVYFHAKTVIQSEEAAWDAVQDTYTAAFRSLEKLKTPETAESWLCAIAGNLCFGRLKKQKLTPPSYAPAAPPAQDAESVRAFVAQRLNALTDMQRVSVLFRYCDDMSLSQIGSVMRCGEAMVKANLDEAEKALNIVRDSAQPGVSPTQLTRALSAIQSDTVLSPAITLSIGSTVAQKCGYSSNLRVTTAADIRSGERPSYSMRCPQATRGRQRESSRRAVRHKGSVLAYGLVIIGFVVGAIAVRGITDYKSASVHPDNVYVFSDEPSGTRADNGAVQPDAQAAKARISSECAQAYIGVISDYTGRYGVCTSQTDGQGLAYAELIDFDGDGQSEMYLYYIDKSFSPENEAYSRNEAGEELWCVHEELWSWNGTLTKCFAQEHFAGGSVDDGTGAGRWLVTDGAAHYLASWYTYTDENGYIHQLLKNYALSDGTLDAREEVSAMFVVANAARQRRDGYLIEEYYGTDSSHFDDIGYFVEGSVTDSDGRRSYNYEKCQAILDIGTADIVPLNDSEETNPVAMLKNSYDARKQSAQLIYPDGTDGSTGIAWQCSDINAFLSMLADICTGGSGNAQS